MKRLFRTLAAVALIGTTGVAHAAPTNPSWVPPVTSNPLVRAIRLDGLYNVSTLNDFAYGDCEIKQVAPAAPNVSPYYSGPSVKTANPIFWGTYQNGAAECRTWNISSYWGVPNFSHQTLNFFYDFGSIYDLGKWEVKCRVRHTVPRVKADGSLTGCCFDCGACQTSSACPREIVTDDDTVYEVVVFNHQGGLAGAMLPAWSPTAPSLQVTAGTSLAIPVDVQDPDDVEENGSSPGFPMYELSARHGATQLAVTNSTGHDGAESAAIIATDETVIGTDSIELTLHVDDDEGERKTFTKKVSVINAPPVVKPGDLFSSTYMDPGVAVPLIVRVSDPDGSSHLATVKWGFTGGPTRSKQGCAVAPHPQPDPPFLPGWAFTGWLPVTQSASGEYQSTFLPFGQNGPSDKHIGQWPFFVTVKDNEGAELTHYFTIVVRNKPPDLTFTGAPGSSVNIHTPISLAPSTTADLDDGNLTFKWWITRAPPGATGVTVDPERDDPPYTGSTFSFTPSDCSHVSDLDPDNWKMWEIVVEVSDDDCSADGTITRSWEFLVVNPKPTIQFSHGGGERDINVGDSLDLRTLITTDDDEGDLSFVWTAIQYPLTYSAAHGPPNLGTGDAIPTMTTGPEHAGTWVFRLTATDDEQCSPDDAAVADFEYLVDALPVARISGPSAKKPDFAPLELSSADPLGPFDTEDPDSPCEGSPSRCHYLDSSAGVGLQISGGIASYKWKMSGPGVGASPVPVSSVIATAPDTGPNLSLSCQQRVDYGMQPGVYSFELEVGDAEQNTDTEVHEVELFPNWTPTVSISAHPAVFEISATRWVTSNITLDGSASNDPDNQFHEVVGPGTGIIQANWAFPVAPCGHVGGFASLRNHFFDVNTRVPAQCMGRWQYVLAVGDDDCLRKGNAIAGTFAITNCPGGVCALAPTATAPRVIPETEIPVQVGVSYVVDPVLFDDGHLAGSRVILEVVKDRAVVYSAEDYNVGSQPKGAALAFNWNGLDNFGNEAPSGVYDVVLRIENPTVYPYPLVLEVRESSAIELKRIRSLVAEYQDSFVPECGPDDPMCVCADVHQFDPVNVAGGNSFVRVQDAVIPSSLGSISFLRSYVSDDSAWAHEDAVAGLPKPFGASPSDQDSLLWWHNFYAFVRVEGNRWDVRDTDGRSIPFMACTSPGCWAPVTMANRSQRERLQWTGGGFVFVRANGERLEFDDKWYSTAVKSWDAYFLTRQKSPSGVVLASIAYEFPSHCPYTGSAATSAPYIKAIATADGTELRPAWTSHTNAHGDAECVVTSVSVANSGAVGSTLVEYDYLSSSGQPEAGLVRKAKWPSTLASGLFTEETYEYSGTNLLRKFAGANLMEHSYSNGSVAGVAARDQSVTLSAPVILTGCTQGLECCGEDRTTRVATVTSSQDGTGTGTAANLTRTFSSVPNYYQNLEPRLLEVIDDCKSSPGSCSPGSRQYEWTCSSGSNPGRLVAEKDKRGSWTVYTHSPAPSGKPVELTELTRVRTGASDKLGTGAVSDVSYGYTYGSNDQQLVQWTSAKSALKGSAGTSSVRYGYDASTNQMTKVVATGWTRTFSETTLAWTDIQRSIGTFFFTVRNPNTGSQSAADPLHRTLEIHGPCEVSGAVAPDGSPAAADCSVVAGGFPVTQFEYWGTDVSVPVNNRNRLRKVLRRASPSTWLTTEFAAYDSLGNPTSVVDPNGVTTALEYDGALLTKQTVAGEVTELFYENQTLLAVKHPAGNFEVFCHRDGTGVGCAGNWKGELRWKAKTDSLAATTWAEKVAYEYWPDGTLAKETYIDACESGTCDQLAGEVRRIAKYGSDAHRRPAYASAGEDGLIQVARAFDGADNVVGVGHAFNDPPALCGGNTTDGSPTSPRCAWLEYDAANRLESMREFTSDLATVDPAMTCFERDDAGNIKSVVAGCESSTDCTTCASLKSQYTFDDFGNVVAVAHPWNNGKISRFEFGTRGLVRKQTADLRSDEWVAFDSDLLGRPLSAYRFWKTPTAGSQLLYRFAYDADEVADASCPQPANTMGRLRFRFDSFGRTFYQYDSHGRLTGEIRLRMGRSVCSSSIHLHPHTFYSYAPGGIIATIQYPHGRTVRYSYGEGARADRIAAIGIDAYETGGWIEGGGEIKDVTWEPYGGLRSYAVTARDFTDAVSVQFQLGENSEDPPVGCPLVPPSGLIGTPPAAQDSDQTGRLRGIWISRGQLAEADATGDILKQTYTWKDDQLVAQQSCFLASATPMEVVYNYDRRLRLTGASGNSFGPIASRRYEYTSRSNLSSLFEDEQEWFLTYRTGGNSDELQTRSSLVGNAVLAYGYDYDDLGRVVRRDGSASTLGFNYSHSGHGGADSVFKAVDVDGLLYEYYFDAFSRRRYKQHPWGEGDEFFHSASSELLVDQGFPQAGYPVQWRIIEDHVWLGGRLVAVVRGKVDSVWSRVPDKDPDCARDGVPGVCGVHFIATDHIGRPILSLDPTGLVAGFLEYDSLGYPNRIANHGHSAASPGSFGTLALEAGPSEIIDARALFHSVSSSDATNYFALSDGSNETPPLWGEFGNVWTEWLTLQSSEAEVWMRGSQTKDGAQLEAFEYRRYEAGATAYSPRIRFPGQYHDPETDLFENWNRYYEPGVGRYLQPEPYLQNPTAWLARAYNGLSLPAYAYASNNPLSRSDPTGNLDEATLQANVDLFREVCGGDSECITSMNLLLAVMHALDKFIGVSEAETTIVIDGKRVQLNYAGAGRVGAVGWLRFSARWRARPITDPRFRTGCEAAARQFQRHVGGDIRRIVPAEGAPSLGPYRGANPGWSHHEVVVSNGRVYDAFTGYKGLSIDEYKALWDYADAIIFGF